MKKISSQLVVITTICILITGIVVGSLSVWQATKSVRGQAEAMAAVSLLTARFPCTFTVDANFQQIINHFNQGIVL